MPGAVLDEEEEPVRERRDLDRDGDLRLQAPRVRRLEHEDAGAAVVVVGVDASDVLDLQPIEDGFGLDREVDAAFATVASTSPALRRVSAARASLSIRSRIASRGTALG